jgi:putative transposase
VQSVRRSFKFRLRPSTHQHVALDACLRDHRTLYNAALEERREAWRRGISVRYGDQSAQLKEIRQECPEQGRWSFSSQQATLRRLNTAFDSFFRRVQSGQKPGYPRYRSRDRWDSVLWPSDGDGCRWRDGRAYLQGIGSVRVSAHRPVEGVVKTLAVKREGHRWYLVLSCDDVSEKPLPDTGKVVGIDMGITAFLATSDGELLANPRHGRNGAARLASAQRVLSRKKRSSLNRKAARAVVGNRHRKVANQRRDFHHQAARCLINAYDVITLEDLAVANMSRSAAGTAEEPGVNVAAKSGLNRSILDAGWGQFAAILVAKAEEAGRQIVKVNPRYTSQTCHECGHVNARNRKGAAFACLACGHTGHADVNAARNVLRAGLAHLAADRAA